MKATCLPSFVLLLAFVLWRCVAQDPSAHPSADTLLERYFSDEVKNLSERCLADIDTLEDWKANRTRYQRELREMLGLDPWPKRGDLRAVVTGRLERPDFTVERLHFQSLPGLYVTANLYLPKGLSEPAPAILYVCGHSFQLKDGVSYGNKVGYHHHGVWFARHGYVCLTIDTIQLGEIEGLHHGTYREGMWWWNSRGYTPGGVEAWNGIRALDYLQSRPEVDGERLGVTGRSGGGAYSWYVAALDERIKATVPVAGITDLENHVVDGTVEGHCDCMFFVNTYQWDYAQLAALVAPRPLLIANSDKDTIFPLDGVVRIHEQVKRIYDLYGATDRLGLLITEGPHKDTQDLRVPTFRWFNRWLKKTDVPIERIADKCLASEDLKVFGTLPADERASSIHDTFVPAAEVPAVPQSKERWDSLREDWMRLLRGRVFRGWPEVAGEVSGSPPNLRLRWRAENAGLHLSVYAFESEANVVLPLYVARRSPLEGAPTVQLRVLGPSDWTMWANALAAGFGAIGTSSNPASDPGGLLAWQGREASPDIEAFTRLVGAVEDHGVIAWCAPRGIGPTAWSGDARKQVQIRRRFMLLGETLDGMRVWDIRRAIQGLAALEAPSAAGISVAATGGAAANALFAALFEPSVKTLELEQLPATYHKAPDYLNVARFLHPPQALALALEHASVSLTTSEPEAWDFAREVADRFHPEALDVTLMQAPMDKPRLLVLTDIGGDPDDRQSMVRLMTYANEFEIEGLIASASGTPGELREKVAKPHLIREIVNAYGKVRPNLARHAPGYPTVEYLLERVKSGNPQRGREAIGEGHDTEGSAWIVRMADRRDPRPLNICIWGGQTDLAQALWRVRADRGGSGLREFVGRLRIHDIADQDGIAEWLWNEFPGLFYVLDQAPAGQDKRLAAFRGMYLGGNESLTSREWIDAHVRRNHGPLGALYPDRTWTAPNPHACLKEGDTPSWFYFLRNGLNDPAHPEWGGWGGRFESIRDRLYRDAHDRVGDVADARCTVWRWRPTFQNELRARMDWCVAERLSDANHPPRAVLNGDQTRGIVRLPARSGQRVSLSATGSEDPDGDALVYRWFAYPEAGSYRGEVRLDSAHASRATLLAPSVEQPVTIHVVLEVSDDGTPSLSSFRRVVLEVSP